MMTFTIGWPQAVYLALSIFGLGFYAVKHGTPRDPYHFGWAIFGEFCLISLLYCGGFFKGLAP